jgi:hypothetical protein
MIVMKLGMSVMPTEAILVAYITNPLNTVASQIVEVVFLILF